MDTPQKTIIAREDSEQFLLLSPREREVFELFCKGLSQKDMCNVPFAGGRKIGYKTINTYMAVVRVKLRCRTELDLMKFAVRQNMIDVWELEQ